MDIREFAQKFIEAEDEVWQNGNFDELEKLEDPNVVYHQNPDVIGREAHKQFILTARRAIPDIHQEWEYLTGDGNVFAVSYKSRGLFSGEVPGFPPPTGKEVSIDAIFVFRLENGKIIEAWEKGT